MAVIDLDLEKVAHALERAGFEVPLGITHTPYADGIVETISNLDQAFRAHRAAMFALRRQLARETFLRECAEKDLEKLKAKIADRAASCGRE